MRGNSSFSSVNGSNSSKQLMIYRRHQDSIQFPPNRLELPMEATSSHEDNSEKFMAKQTYSKTNFRRSVSPIKMMSNEKACESTKRGPSVVARLMGMDSLPVETRPTIHLKERFEENPRKFISRVPRFEGNKPEPDSISLNNLKQPKEESPLNHDKHYSSPSTKALSSVKPLRREHPQEELLQKFKKDFEAWQASKAWGCSANLDHHEIVQKQKDEHVVAMQNFNMEKTERHSSSERYQVHKKPKEIEAYASINKQDGKLNEQCLPRTKDDITMRKAASIIEPVSKASFQDRRSRSCSPTRIVILKPSADTKEELNESWRGSSEVLGKGSSMEDFLEEVKERLRLEMEGKGRKESIKRGSGTHASVHERSADPKQLAHDVAKHMRESVRDFGAPKLRSDSTRIYVDDFNLNEKEKSEAMKREARKLIPHIMKNALKDDYEDDTEKKKSNKQRTGNSLLHEEEGTASISMLSKVGKGASFWEDKKAVNESIPKYGRWEPAKRVLLDAETMSPSNFIRSFSAPASSADVRKLILEDHHLVTRSPGLLEDEASESDSSVFNKNKKDGFNIKGRVSNLTRSFNFKGKIFGKKVTYMGESTPDTFNYVHSTGTVPTVIRNLGELQDNPTEVPPSPASFSSSPISFHLSQESQVEAPCVGENSKQVTCESSGLPERISQPEILGSKGSGGVATEAQVNDDSEVTYNEGHAESYVRNILAVSGLCKGWPSSNQVNLSLCGKIKPLDSWVFDKVEENYTRHGKMDDDKSGLSLAGINVRRKVLFDLVNEALLNLLGAPMAQLSSIAMPNGSKLLDSVLHQMNMYARTKVDQSLSVDKLLALDVKLGPSLTVFNEDTNSIGEELELLIVGELFDELVLDLLV